MARPIQDGLRYFPLDVDADYDDKVQLIEGLHGAIGFAVIIKMFMKIYSSGYFYKWEEKEQILIAKRIGIDSNSVNNIINDCVKYELFQEKLFNEYRILTSDGVQKRYFTAVGKKKKGDVIKEYLLIGEQELHEMCPLMVIKSVIPEKTVVIPELMPVIPDSGTQMKLNKIKENKIKANETIKTENKPPAAANIFTIYEQNFGMLNPMTIETVEKWEADLGEELVIEAMRRAAVDNKAFRYAEGIMRSWLKTNVKTVADAEAQDVAYKQRQNGNAPKKEKMPEWAENTAPVTETAPDPDQQRAIQERIARLKSSRKMEVEG